MNSGFLDAPDIRARIGQLKGARGRKGQLAHVMIAQVGAWVRVPHL